MSRVSIAFGAAMFLAVLGVGLGCSSDDVTGDATAQGVEAGLNSALANTVEPLYSFLAAVPTIVAPPAALRSAVGGGVTCPDTSGVCGGGGSVACTPSGGGFTLTFDFDQCIVVTGDAPFTLDGVVIATPGDPILLTLNALFINDNSASMTGTGSVSVSACSYQVNVGTTDGTSVNGTIIQCDADNFPTAQSNLTVGLDDVLLTITFDGSSVAHAVANQGGNTIANCSINLAAQPLSSSCSAP
jgi:hypothetical protein